MNKRYGYDFYKDRHKKTVYAASVILSIIVEVLPKLNSAIDFGCGVGTWLLVLKEKGCQEILGLDGHWVNQDLLVIPKETFRQVDFEKRIKIDKRYDLAICLEVAEHVSKENTNNFIDALTQASDYILFSAAIPFQGGKGHINEQWPNFWTHIFNNKGYVALDIIRNWWGYWF